MHDGDIEASNVGPRVWRLLRLEGRGGDRTPRGVTARSVESVDQGRGRADECHTHTHALDSLVGDVITLTTRNHSSVAVSPIVTGRMNLQHYLG